MVLSIKNVGIVGIGQMGTGIAHVFAGVHRLRHRHGLAGNPDRDELADVVPDTTLWLGTVLPERCYAAGHYHTGYLCGCIAFRDVAGIGSGSHLRVPIGCNLATQSHRLVGTLSKELSWNY